MWNLPITIPGINRQFKKLEDLIMATREQLNAAIAGLGDKIAAEKEQVLSVLQTLNTTIEELKAKIEELEAPEDFAAELAALDGVAGAIAAIYEPPAPPVEPTPVVDDDLA